MRDLANEIHPVVAIPPAAAVANNAPIVSAIIDTVGFQSLAFLILLGVLGTDAATFAVTVAHGNQPNLSDGAIVPDVNLTGTAELAAFTGTSDGKARKVGYTGSMRYVQLTITPTGNAAASYIAALALLGDARSVPTPNPPS